MTDATHSADVREQVAELGHQACTSLAGAFLATAFLTAFLAGTFFAGRFLGTTAPLTSTKALVGRLLACRH
ncbi:MAG: hypothetical protein E6Q55_22200 [Mycolicibacterium mageritense]|nr:MAG: hypothetical protein E6Q55_22200 [Mycolicibacterium mageritense]